MEPIIKQQLAIHEDLQRSFRNYKKDGKDRKTSSYIKNKIEFFEEQWHTYKNNHRQLASLDKPEELEENFNAYFVDNHFARVEELFLEAKSTMQDDLSKKLTQLSTPVSEIAKEVIPSSTKNNIKLPKIDLPKFNGDYRNWKSFFDLFVTLIHNNDSVPPVQKLHYLKASLQGEAELLLRHFTVSAGNYVPAWNRLKERFDNPRILIKTQLKTLLSQPCASRDTAWNIRRLLDTTNECIQALKNLDVDTDGWDTILTYLVSERLSVDTKKLWEQHIGAKREYPTFNELIQFLEGQFRALESLGSHLVNTRQSQPKQAFQIVKTETCILCAQSHSIRKCPDFLKANHSERRNIVINKNLCSNCLSRGHHAKQCPSQTSCFKCNHRHHTLLHNKTVIANKTRANSEREVSHNVVNQCNSILDNVSTTENLHVGNLSVGSEVLLATAMVKLIAPNGVSTIVRALIDQGSQASFITESVRQRLNLKGIPVRVNISGLCNTPTGTAKSQVNITLASLNYDFKLLSRTLVLTNLNNILPTGHFT